MKVKSKNAAAKILGMYCDCVRQTLLACDGYECQEKDGEFMIAFREAMHALEWSLVV